MSLCPYCGNDNPDTNNFCSSCGAKLMRAPAKPEVENEPIETHEETSGCEPPQIPEETSDHWSEPAPAETEAGPAFENSVNEQQPVYQQTPPPYSGYGQQPPEKIPIGGYIAWAIVNILFCTIPGAIGLYFVLKINKAPTQDDQLRAVDSAKKALMIGSVLAALNLLMQIVANM